MSMYNIISVSNRKLCADFLTRLREINDLGIPIILREKDLPESEYETLAKRVLKFAPDVILHTFLNTARKLSVKKIHLPLHILKTADISGFDVVGASVHSADEAVLAESLGASYITAGHIFRTECKRGLEPRGLEFLNEVCNSVKIPVYAIGGITPENAKSAIDAGASGVCVMSGLMACENAREYVKKYGG